MFFDKSEHDNDFVAYLVTDLFITGAEIQILLGRFHHFTGRTYWVGVLEIKRYQLFEIKRRL